MKINFFLCTEAAVLYDLEYTIRAYEGLLFFWFGQIGTPEKCQGEIFCDGVVVQFGCGGGGGVAWLVGSGNL